MPHNSDQVIQLGILEDNLEILEYLKTLFQQEPGFQLNGIFHSCEELIKLFSKKTCSFCKYLLVDLTLKGESGITAIQFLRKNHPRIKCIVFTIHEDNDHVFNALEAGAYGYLLKGSSASEIINGIKLLDNGGAPMSPTIANKVIRHFHEIKKPEERTDQEKTVEILSSRELDVLQRMVKAYSYHEIAEELHISKHTVHVHFKNIYRKLQATSRSEILSKASHLKIL